MCFQRGPQPRYTAGMSDVTNILSAIENGNPAAAERLLPLVYGELRKLAAAKMAREKPGQTLQATALVHEAYLRLVDRNQVQRWDSSGHFFAAAAEAMRRILVEHARRKLGKQRGGDRDRVKLGDAVESETTDPETVLHAIRRPAPRRRWRDARHRPERFPRHS